MRRFSRAARQVFSETTATLNTVRSKGALAKQDTGKSIASQFAEIIALRLGPGKLEAAEYYQYRLYDDNRFSWRDKKQFFGRIMENALVPVLHEAVRLTKTGLSVGALRVASGARLVSRVAFDPTLGATPEDRLAGQIAAAAQVLDKIELILTHWPSLSRQTPSANGSVLQGQDLFPAAAIVPNT